MIYTYVCTTCENVYEKQRSVEKRYDVECPWCDASEGQEIILHPVRGTMVRHPQLVSEAQVVSERGADWRETPGSRRMAAGEPERLYSVAGATTRKGRKAKR